MRRQRNMAQMKVKNKTLEKELNKMETSNLLDAEFKTLVTRTLKELRGKVDELRENFIIMKKVMETIKNNQSEMKDILTEIKNNLQGINSGVDEAKNQINDLEHKEAKNNQSEQQEKKEN